MPMSEMTAATIHGLAARHAKGLPVDYVGMDSNQLSALSTAPIWRWWEGKTPQEEVTKARLWNRVVRSAAEEAHRREFGWAPPARF